MRRLGQRLRWRSILDVPGHGRTFRRGSWLSRPDRGGSAAGEIARAEHGRVVQEHRGPNRGSHPVVHRRQILARKDRIGRRFIPAPLLPPAGWPCLGDSCQAPRSPALAVRSCRGTSQRPPRTARSPSLTNGCFQIIRGADSPRRAQTAPYSSFVDFVPVDEKIVDEPDLQVIKAGQPDGAGGTGHADHGWRNARFANECELEGRELFRRECRVNTLVLRLRDPPSLDFAGYAQAVQGRGPDHLPGRVRFCVFLEADVGAGQLADSMFTVSEISRHSSASLGSSGICRSASSASRNAAAVFALLGQPCDLRERPGDRFTHACLPPRRPNQADCAERDRYACDRDQLAEAAASGFDRRGHPELSLEGSQRVMDLGGQAVVPARRILFETPTNDRIEIRVNPRTDLPRRR